MTRHHRTRSYKKSSSNAGGGKLLMLGLIIALVLVILWQQKNQAPTTESAVISTAVGKQTHLNKTQSAAPGSSGHKKPVQKPKTPEFDFYTVLPQMQVQPPNNNPQNGVKNPSASELNASKLPLSATPVNQVSVPMTPAPENAVVATESMPMTNPVNSQEIRSVTLESSLKNEEMNAKKVRDSNDITSVAPMKNSGTERYALQVASMKNYHDADQLKAELLMLGLEVSIQKVTIEGEVWNRVYAGSYKSREAALKQQKLLKEHSISSILVKK